MDQVLVFTAALAFIILVVAGFALVYIAGSSMASGRGVKWESIFLVLMVLFLLLVGLRYYPPAFIAAFIDGIRRSLVHLPELQTVVAELADPLVSSFGGDTSFADAVDTPEPEQPVSEPPTAVPAAPTADEHAEEVGGGTPEPEATAAPPTAVPTATPIPPTPTATVFICTHVSDVLAGCHPPTPIPGR